MDKKLTSRQLQAINSKIKISKCAFELFREYGYEKVKITDICQKAGISVGNFYHYFKSKDKILETSYSDVDSLVERAYQNQNYATYSEKILGLFKEAMNEIETMGKQFMANIFKQLLSTETTYNISKQRFPYQLLEEQLVNGIKSGEFIEHDTTAMINLFMRLGRGYVFEWAQSASDFDLIEESLIAVNTVIDGIRANNPKNLY